MNAPTPMAALMPDADWADQALDAMGSKGGVTDDTKRAIREALGIV